MTHSKRTVLAAAPPPPPREIQPIVSTPPPPGADFGTPGGGGGIRATGNYIHKDIRLLLSTYNITSGLVLRLSGEIQTVNGEISHFQQDYAIASTGALVTNALYVGEGYLQSVFVSVASGSPGYGDVYCELGLLKGGTISRAAQVGLLLSGYVTANRTLSPTTSGTNSQFGTPTLVDTGGALPFATDIPTSKQVLLKYIYVTSQTSAVVGNRILLIKIQSTNGGTTRYQITSPVVQPASTVYHYHIGPGVTSSASALAGASVSYVNIAMPNDLHLVEANSIYFDADNRQAGDQFQVARVTYDVYSL